MRCPLPACVCQRPSARRVLTYPLFVHTAKQGGSPEASLYTLTLQLNVPYTIKTSIQSLIQAGSRGVMSRPQTPAYQARQARAQPSYQSPGRTGTPLASKQVITLEEWERLAPLDDSQLQSINTVKDRFAERPLPENVSSLPPRQILAYQLIHQLVKAESSAQGASRATSPSRRPRPLAGLLSTPSRASSRPSSVPPSPKTDRFDPLHPVALVTPQQFHDHFTALTLSTEHEQDSLYRDHLAEIIAIREKCDNILHLLEEGELEIEEMLKCLSYVEERSESLRGACEDLLEEQTHLLTHTSQLAHRLTFFTFLENAQRMLNNSSGDLVLSADFLPMVKRLDECIGYLGDHVSNPNPLCWREWLTIS